MKCRACGFVGEDINIFVKNGKHPIVICRSCHRKLTRESYSKNTEYSKLRAPRRRAEANKLIRELKSTSCIDCGGLFHYSQMDFDHRDQSNKRRPISRMNMMGLDSIKKEIDKCDLVCVNCHRNRTQIQIMDLLKSKIPIPEKDKLRKWHHDKLQETMKFVNDQKDNKKCLDCGQSFRYWIL